MNIETIDHIGIRVADLDRAMAFYELFGFKVIHKAGNDPVAVVEERRRGRTEPRVQRQ